MRVSRLVLALVFLPFLNCNNLGLLDQIENPGAGKAETFTTKNYVFYSSWMVKGDMAGVPFSECNGLTGPERADCGCTRSAAANGLRKSSGHQFKAWLSTSLTGGDAKCRIQNSPANGCTTPGSEPWYNTMGQIVFNTLTDTADNAPSLPNPIRYSETKADNGVSQAWTGTIAGGTVGTTCSNWTSSAVTSPVNNTGERTQINGGWTAFGTSSCDVDQRIICFSMP